MKTSVEAWRSGRPIYERLPEDGYQDNEVADWLTMYWDDFSVQLKALIDDLPRQLNPWTCDPEWLDFLAALCGAVGEYWSSNWRVETKRVLIAGFLAFIWENRGTKEVLEYVLTAFFQPLGVHFDVWEDRAFVADVTELPGDLGEPEYRYFIRLQISVPRTSEEFRLAKLIDRLYGAGFCDRDVVYDGFYADFSLVGDPVFEAFDTIT